MLLTMTTTNAIKPATNMENNKQGSGKYRPNRKRAKRRVVQEEFEFDYLTRADQRMRFNNSRDPIYYVFECLEKQSVGQLAETFVKDTFFEISNFVSKVVK